MIRERYEFVSDGNLRATAARLDEVATTALITLSITGDVAHADSVYSGVFTSKFTLPASFPLSRRRRTSTANPPRRATHGFRITTRYKGLSNGSTVRWWMKPAR
jgi:hypothetical protein